MKLMRGRSIEEVFTLVKICFDRYTFSSIIQLPAWSADRIPYGVQL
jgi:hypothetical protein